MMRDQNKGTGTLRAFTAAGVFMLALFMPVLLCGCADTSQGDALLMDVNGQEEVQVQQTCTELEEIVQAPPSSEEARSIYVYVCGAVNNPDVYQVDEDSRLFELIALAGGFTAEADEACLNLARSVADGEQIRVFTKEETAQNMTLVSENASANTAQKSGLVNINTASIAELTSVTGIGESRAQAIIAYREKNGGFRSIEEIKKVDGIKDGLFSKIKDYITV